MKRSAAWALLWAPSAAQHAAWCGLTAPQILYSLEARDSMRDDFNLFSTVYLEVVRGVENYNPHSAATGVNLFASRGPTVPTTSDSLILGSWPPGYQPAWQVRDFANDVMHPFMWISPPIPMTQDPDLLTKGEIGGSYGSNGVSEIVEILLNHRWGSGGPRLHVLFTDGLPYFRGFSHRSAFDSQPVLWNDLQNAQSSYPDYLEARERIRAKRDLAEHFVAVISQVTRQREDTRQAWAQALEALGLGGRFIVEYLPLEQSPRLQHLMMHTLQTLVCAYNRNETIPYPSPPPWPPITTTTTRRTTTTTRRTTTTTRRTTTTTRQTTTTTRAVTTRTPSTRPTTTQGTVTQTTTRTTQPITSTPRITTVEPTTTTYRSTTTIGLPTAGTTTRAVSEGADVISEPPGNFMVVAAAAGASVLLGGALWYVVALLNRPPVYRMEESEEFTGESVGRAALVRIREYD
eukprot:Gregarina_sp_Poly_1__955@NODE_1231_length_4702_cov_15_366343_g838_i0_p2_GENE_NODE_1231_length_4702_cov_15_366343_g838_i0NODE_1231_length_4702_cov_15_366343_g838_i0_p2_ORF_typecomplete_len461_score24_98Hamartin/PF04388_12/0_67KAR9/PF08580_10/0_74_NODE_1231_length_4702_cov_15_366343_g838_i013252707